MHCYPQFGFSEQCIVNNDYQGYNFGDEGVPNNDNDQTNGNYHEGNSRDNNEFLLNTYLKHGQWTPSDPYPNPLSFSHSHCPSHSNSIPHHIDQPPLNHHNDNNRTNDQYHFEVNSTDDDKPLLDTTLRYGQWTPSDPSSNPLSFSLPHSRSHSNSAPYHIDESPLNDYTDNNPNQQRVHQQPHFYPTPRDSTDCLSTIKLDSIYNKLIQAGFDDIEFLMEANDDDFKEIRCKLKKEIRLLKNRQMYGKEENVNQWRQSMETNQKQMMNTLNLLLSHSLRRKSKKGKRHKKRLRGSKRKRKSKNDTETKERHEIDKKTDRKQKAAKSSRKKRALLSSSGMDGQYTKTYKKMLRNNERLHMVGSMFDSDACNMENFDLTNEQQFNALKKKLNYLNETQLQIYMVSKDLFDE